MNMPPLEDVKPKVLLFRNELLPASETFIQAQAGALRLFDPRFAGVHAALKFAASSRRSLCCWRATRTLWVSCAGACFGDPPLLQLSIAGSKS